MMQVLIRYHKMYITNVLEIDEMYISNAVINDTFYI